MNYVLILIIFAGSASGGTQVREIGFNSVETCEAARNIIQPALSNKRLSIAVCVKR